jgi:hypothetical protein
MAESVRAVLVLGVVWGCYAAPVGARLPEETVSGRRAWVDANQAPREYLHLSTTPFIGPYYVLVSLSGHYCVVPDAVYVSVQDNQRWACDWRPLRPAGLRFGPPAAADIPSPRIPG